MKSSWLVINVRSCGSRTHHIGFFLVLPRWTKEREEDWITYSIINRKAFHEEPQKATLISELGVYETVFYMAEWRVTLLTEAGVSPSKEGLEPLHIYLFRNEP